MPEEACDVLIRTLADGGSHVRQAARPDGRGGCRARSRRRPDDAALQHRVRHLPARPAGPGGQPDCGRDDQQPCHRATEDWRRHSRLRGLARRPALVREPGRLPVREPQRGGARRTAGTAARRLRVRQRVRRPAGPAAPRAYPRARRRDTGRAAGARPRVRGVDDLLRGGSAGDWPHGARRRPASHHRRRHAQGVCLSRKSGSVDGAAVGPAGAAARVGAGASRLRTAAAGRRAGRRTG